MAAIFNFTGNLSGRLARTPEPETVPANGYYTKIETDAAIEAAIAAVVGGAPAVLDTLKEIADVIGTEAGSGAAGILKRVVDLEDGKVDKIQGKGLSANDYTNADKAKLDRLSPQAQSDWSQTDTTAPDFIKNKPTIPAPVTIDPSLSPTSKNPVQNKAVAAALYTGFTEWEFSDGLSHEISGPREVYSPGQVSVGWVYQSTYNDVTYFSPFYETEALALATLEITFSHGSDSFTATRHLITPTKTSQLTNDGPSSGPNVGHPFATTNQIPAPVDISGKLDGAAAYPAWNDRSEGYWPAGTIVSWKGRLYRTEYGTADQSAEPGTSAGATDWAEITIQLLLAAKANAADVNAALALKASFADLPYAMVTIGEWVTSNPDYSVVEADGAEAGAWWSLIDVETGEYFGMASGNADSTSLTFIFGPDDTIVTATRSFALLDRANNLVDATTGDVTLTLPEYQEGKVRDLLVHVDLGYDGTDPYTVTVNFPSGETSTGFKVKGNASAPLPAPDAAGEWLFSFSESSPHKMAVSLAQLQDATVAGGS